MMQSNNILHDIDFFSSLLCEESNLDPHNFLVEATVEDRKKQRIRFDYFFKGV